MQRGTTTPSVFVRASNIVVQAIFVALLDWLEVVQISCTTAPVKDVTLHASYIEVVTLNLSLAIAEVHWHKAHFRDVCVQVGEMTVKKRVLVKIDFADFILPSYLSAALAPIYGCWAAKTLWMIKQINAQNSPKYDFISKSSQYFIKKKKILKLQHQERTSFWNFPGSRSIDWLPISILVGARSVGH